VIIALLSLGLATAYAPWMAAFTETIERRNPALTATGLAIWGWLLRVVVAVSFLILPHVINSVTPLVDNGAQVKAAAARNPVLVAEATAHPDIFAQLAKYKNPKDIPPAVINHAIVTVGAPTLLLLQKPQAQADLKFLQQHAADVQSAQKSAPHQWQHWLWVCVGGQIFFIPMIFLMAGYWRPRRAKEALEEHDRAIMSQPAAAESPA
jgi:hypothetical protein